MTSNYYNRTLKGSNEREMGVDLYLNSKLESNRPVLIFCHGYKGFKDWGCWELVAKEFSSQGFNFIKFNFSHNGVTPEHPIDFADLEAFGNNNYTKELFDLNIVIDWVTTNTEFDNYFDSSSVYLIGHSRGGGIVSLTSAKDDRVKKAITWASVSSLVERLPKNTEEWKEKGVIFQMNGRTKQEMPLYFQLYENTEMNKNELEIEKWAKKITIPFCIIHGADDPVVGIEEAEKLNEYIPTSQFVVIEKAGHTFGSFHPYTETDLPKEMKLVVEQSLRFLMN